jgi:hypothetical protein
MSLSLWRLHFRDHLLACRAIDYSMFDALPPAPPGIHKIDHALNLLPTKASSGPPFFWPALLQLLHAIDCLVHPLAVIAPDPDPAEDSWLPASVST